VAAVWTLVPTGKFTFAGNETTAFDGVPVLCSFNPALVTMLTADQWETVSQPPGLTGLDLLVALSPHDLSDSSPYTSLISENFRVAKEIEATFCSRQSNTCAVFGIEETNVVSLIRSYETEKDNVIPRRYGY
jgi:hypothetical protein